MFANFTEETCTGTGVTLALAGITTGNIAFSKSFADGDLVAYVVEDSGGTIKVAGVGTYVSATDDITRNDTWNWNGTVIDDSPSTNITLSGGTHTVRCSDSSYTKATMAEVKLSAMNTNHRAMPDNWLQLDDNPREAVADQVIYVAAHYSTPFTFNTLSVTVVTANASTVCQVGIVTCGLDGLPDKVIEIVTIDVTATGIVKTTLSKTYKLPAGRYFTAFVQSDVNASFWSVQNHTHSGRVGAYVFRAGAAGSLQSSGASSGIITTPLVAPNTGTDPLDNIMVLPELV